MKIAIYRKQSKKVEKLCEISGEDINDIINKMSQVDVEYYGEELDEMRFALEKEKYNTAPYYKYCGVFCIEGSEKIDALFLKK